MTYACGGIGERKTVLGHKLRGSWGQVAERDGGADLGLNSGGSEVWCADDVWVCDKRVVLGRFLAEHVQGSLGDLATLDSREEVLLLDDASTGDVDDADTLLALVKHLNSSSGVMW